jgi:hypothetical protein
LWKNSKQPTTDFLIGEWWISLSPVPKGTHLGCLRGETNHSRMVLTSYFLLFGVLRIQAKTKKVLNHHKYLSFISPALPNPPMKQNDDKVRNCTIVTNDKLIKEYEKIARD